MGLTPLQIKSEIEDLIIFFITKYGLLKFIKCVPSMYVSTDTTKLFFLCVKTEAVDVKIVIANAVPTVKCIKKSS